MLASLCFAQPDNDLSQLSVYKEDIIVEERDNDWRTYGVDLYVRKKPGVESVMLAETTKDPNGKMDNFAYRAEEYNPVNGDEIRLLNGEVLKSEYSKYSLVSSTVVTHPELGQSFHIYVPRKLVYGYPWERHGEAYIEKGLFINIRTFSKKYCDYTGEFADNPFMFDYQTLTKIIKRKKEIPVPVVEPEPEPEPEPIPEPIAEPEPEAILDLGPEPEPEPIPEPEPEPIPEPEPEPEPIPEPEPEPEPIPEPEPATPLTDEYNEHALSDFNDIAEKGKGFMTYSKGPESLPDDLYNIVESINPKDKVDLIFAIDATGSMKDDMESLRKNWIPRFMEQVKEFKDIRIGLLFYRDYVDNWKYKQLPVMLYPFTSSFSEFQNNFERLWISGSEGGDIPEPVYEALYASLKYYDWRSDAVRKIVLIGDAQPHGKPRGRVRVNQDTVIKLATEKDVNLNCVIVPDGHSKTTRRR